jgi:hypothetical protein
MLSVASPFIDAIPFRLAYMKLPILLEIVFFFAHCSENARNYVQSEESREITSPNQPKAAFQVKELLNRPSFH